MKHSKWTCKFICIALGRWNDTHIPLKRMPLTILWWEMIVLFQIISILLPQRFVVGLTPAFRIFQFWFKLFSLKILDLESPLPHGLSKALGWVGVFSGTLQYVIWLVAVHELLCSCLFPLSTGVLSKVFSPVTEHEKFRVHLLRTWLASQKEFLLPECLWGGISYFFHDVLKILAEN